MSIYVEERLARRIAARHALKPPVAIEDLASRYATVTSIEFPVNVDGVTLHLKAIDRKPEILINKAQAPKRWRFTLAHELGHVLIPGHTGSIVDDTDLSQHEQSKYREMEAEANRFASEILMPTEWAILTIGKPDDMARQVSRLAEKAEVSVDAATLKVLRVAPAGYIVAKEKNGRVVWSGKTTGSRSNKPVRGSIPENKTIYPVRQYSKIPSSDGVYHWWREEERVELPDAPEQAWRLILQEIVSELPLANPTKSRQSINGIIAVANGAIRENRSREVIYAACLHNVRNRATNNNDVELIINHPRFNDFLLARVYDFNI